MKYLIYALLTLSTIVLIFNITKLNFDDLFLGDSSIALIGVFASLCVIILMLILLVSRTINDKLKD